MRKQQGLTLIGFIFMAALVAGAGLIVFQSIPIYNEYFTLQKILKSIDVGQNQDATPGDIRNQFSRKAAADYMYDIKPQELDVTKENGRIVITVNYTRVVKLAGNVSLLYDFQATNRK